MIARLVTRLLLSALFSVAAVLHLLRPRLFCLIMPPMIPFPTACVVISGIFELLGAIGLLIPQRRIQQLTGISLTLLLLAVFPANIYMAVENIRVGGFPSHRWMSWARLPLQPLLMLAVLWVTRLWPPARDKIQS